MNRENDSIAIILANRQYVYTLLQRIFGNEPSKESLTVIIGEQTKEYLELFFDHDDDTFRDFLSLLEELKQSVSVNTDETLDKLQREYTHLMIGPNKLPAPPWESVYRSEARVIFQESTLIVRRAYLNYNFLPANYPHEADDHIALELDFMAHLAKLLLESFEENQIEEVKKLLADQKSFLEEHLLTWVGQFAEQIQNSKTHYFYPQIAEMTHQFLQIDAEIINELFSLLE